MSPGEAIEADAIRRSGIPWPEWLAVDQCVRNHFRTQATWAAKDAEIAALTADVERYRNRAELVDKHFGQALEKIAQLRAEIARRQAHDDAVEQGIISQLECLRGPQPPCDVEAE